MIRGNARSFPWKNVRGRIFPNHPLAPLTTWKIGGPAQWLIIPRDLDDVSVILTQAQRFDYPVFFLGGGSNLLIADSGLPGVTLLMARAFKKIDLQDDLLRVGAGVYLPHLVTHLARQGWSGLEFLAGIPGTVGAAVRGNVGIGPGRELAPHVRQVQLLTPQLKMLSLSSQELAYGYRRSLLLNFPHWLVLEAEFHLKETAPPEDIQAHIRHLLAARRAKAPANPRNCGSIFKNPPEGPPAGLLIEQAGLKGQRCGDAQVSPQHANYIVNCGHSTAAQVKYLVNQVVETVFKVHGIVLQREVVFLPEDVLT